MFRARQTALRRGLAGCVVALAACGLVQTGAHAQTADATPPGLVKGPGDVLMFESGPVDPRNTTLQFQQIADGRTEGQVVGANTAFDPTRLLATFKMTFAEGGLCTATLIGPKVVLTAAHCVDMRDDIDGVPQIIPGGISLPGNAYLRRFKACQMAKSYTDAPIPKARTPRNAKDWALCELRQPLTLPRETLTLDAGDAAPGRAVMIAGFGCTEDDLTAGAITGWETAAGLLTVGDNVLEADRSKGWLTILGRIGEKRAIVCPGDSGGAAFVDASSTRSTDDGRRVLAVNSAVGPSDAQAARWKAGQTDARPEYVSLLAPLSDPDFVAFLDAFVSVDAFARAVCVKGRGPLPSGCRP